MHPPISALDPPKNNRKKQLEFYVSHLDNPAQMAVLESVKMLSTAPLADLISLRNSITSERLRDLLESPGKENLGARYVAWRLLGICGDEPDGELFGDALTEFEKRRLPESSAIVEGFILLKGKDAFEYFGKEWLSPKSSSSSESELSEFHRLNAMKRALESIWTNIPYELDTDVDSLIPRDRLILTTKKFLGHPSSPDFLLDSLIMFRNEPREWGIVRALESIHDDNPESKMTVINLLKSLSNSNSSEDIPRPVIVEAKRILKKIKTKSSSD